MRFYKLTSYTKGGYTPDISLEFLWEEREESEESLYTSHTFVVKVTTLIEKKFLCRGYIRINGAHNTSQINFFLASKFIICQINRDIITFIIHNRYGPRIVEYQNSTVILNYKSSSHWLFLIEKALRSNEASRFCGT